MKKFLRILLLIILAIVAVGVFAFTTLAGKIQGPDSPQEIVVTPGVQQNGYTNIAVFGVDSRDNNLDSANSDAIMVFSLNHSTKEMKLISVYRDTLMDMGDEIYQKANAAYMIGGPENAVNVLNRNLDLDIDKYVSVNFEAVSKIVDLVGGVNVDLTAEEAGYVNYYIEETARIAGEEPNFLPEQDGTYTLDGPQAVSYTRIRYTAGNDYKRTERQRIILSKVLEKLKSAGPVKMYQVASEILPMVQTNMSIPELGGLAINALQGDMPDTTGFPFNPYSEYVDGLGDCVVVDDLGDEVVLLHQYMFPNLDYTLSETARQASIGFDEVLGRYY